MVARVALVSNCTSDTEPITIGVSGIQFGQHNPNDNTGEAVGHTTVLRGEPKST